MIERLVIAMAVAAIVAGFPTRSAQAGDEFACDAFAKNEDGSWSAMRDVDVPGPGRDIKIRRGSWLKQGATILGTDVAEYLDKQCPGVVAGAPPPGPGQTPGQGPAPGPAPGPGQPPVSVTRQYMDVSKFADANGNIDVRKLNCGQLTSVSPADTEFLLSWYSGWSNGLLKKNAMNVPKLKEGIHDIVIYCRANTDKLVSQAISVVSKLPRR